MMDDRVSLDEYRGQQSRFDWIDTSQPIEPVLDSNWLVRDVLPAEGSGVIYGRSGSGKTFAAIDLCCHVAAGRPWRGHITKGGAVAYVALEGGSLTINRVIAWKREHDAIPRLLLTSKSVDLRSSEDDADALIDELTEHNARNPDHPVAIIAIDTLNRAFGGGNENAPDDMGAFVNIVAKIADALKCLVLVVHHSGKDEAKGSRGHSSLQAATNVEIEIKREQGEAGIIKITKQRDGVDGTEYGFELEPVVMGIDQDGIEVTTCVAMPVDAAGIKKAKRKERGPSGKNQKTVWAAMIELEANGTKSPGVMGIPEGAMIVAETRLFDAFAREIDDDGPDFRKRESFGRAIKAMQRDGWIKTTGGNIWRC